MASNPLHPVTRAMADQWHTICALMMDAKGLKEFEITEDMAKQFTSRQTHVETRQNIVADCRAGRFIIRLLDEAEAIRLMKVEHEGN